MKSTLLVLILLLLTTLSSFGQEAPKVPLVPEGYKTQILQLVVHQKNLRIHIDDLSTEAQATLKTLGELDAKGKALQEEILTKLKLDSKKFDVVVTTEGEVNIVSIPPDKK